MLFGILWLWDYERGKDGEMKGVMDFSGYLGSKRCGAIRGKGIMGYPGYLGVSGLLGYERNGRGEGTWIVQIIWVIRVVWP